MAAAFQMSELDDNGQWLLDECRSSNIALRALANYVGCKQDYRACISRAVVHFLQAEAIPWSDYDAEHPCILAARGAMDVLIAQVKVLLALDKPRTEFAALFNHHYADFLEWLRFFCSKGIFIIPSAAFIVSILDLDETLRHRFMDSLSAIDLVLNMWMQQDEGGRYHVLDEANVDEACPLLAVVWRVAGTQRGNATLRDGLRSTPSEIRAIADTIQGRVQQLRQRSSSAAFTVGQLRGLARVTSGLLYRPQHDMELFHSHNILYEMCASLNLCLSGKTCTTLWTYTSDVLAAIYSFILKSGIQSGNPLAKVISVVRGGLIRLLLNSLLYVPTTHFNYPFAANFLRDIMGYIAYRDVAASLIIWINFENLGTVARACEPPLLFTQCWKEVLDAAQTHGESDGPRIAWFMCDALHHYNRPGRRKTKQCSGCRERSYCSVECQKDDWDARHRDECKGLSRLLPPEVDQGSGFRLHARANLAAFVERMCNKYLDAFQVHAQRAFLAPLASLVIRINAIAVPFTGGLSSVPEFMTSVRASFGDAVPQQQRVRDYLSQMLTTSDVYVAYAVFPLGSSTLHVLVRLRKDAADVCRVASFLTIGINQCPSDPTNIWTAREMRNQ